MTYPSRILAAVALLGCASGCSYLFTDKADDYRKAFEIPSTEVPAGDSAVPLTDIYPVPPVTDEVLPAGNFSVPRPQPLVSGSADERVRIQSLGEETWALVAIPPGQLWPEVRGFLSAAGVQVNRVDARAGVMETGWLKMENEPVAARFRFRIDQGVQRGTSELHVLQMNQAGGIDRWPEKSDSPQQEQDMLKAVAQYVANSSESTPVSMIADQAISASGKISMRETADGKPYLEVGLPFDRAWASLAKALEDSGFVITDRDRSSGKYYIRYASESEDDGWFNWLFGDDEHPWANRDYEAWIAADGQNRVTIRLLPAGDDPPFDRAQEQAMLALLKGNIS